MAQVEFTAARSGTGKTFRRCAHFLVNEWLPNYTGIHYSNFPVNIPELIAFARKKWPNHDSSNWEERIHVIPREVTDSWKPDRAIITREKITDEKTGEQETVEHVKRLYSGPWEYFKDKDLSGAHIALDEIHNFVSTKAPEHKLSAWKSWAGDLRHEHVLCFEAISQYETKVATLIRHEAGLRRYLINRSDEIEYFSGIKRGDLYQWIACVFGGKPEPLVVECEEVEQKSKWVEIRRRQFHLSEEYYPLYNSYSKAEGGGTEIAATEKQPYLTHTRWGITRWLIRRNWWGMLQRVGVVLLLLFLFSGGLGRITPYLTSFFTVPTSSTDSVAHERQDVAGETMPARVRGPNALVAIGARYVVFAGYPVRVRVGDALPFDDSQVLHEINAVDRFVKTSKGEVIWLGY